MVPGHVRGEQILVDISAAKSGGGLAWARELYLAFPAIGSGHDYHFAMRADMASRLGPPAERMTVLLVPRLLSSAPLRTIWQHGYLRRYIRQATVAWILCPFNVLPALGSIPATIRSAVVVSNLAPFAPELSRGLRGYQAARTKVLGAMTLDSVRRADLVFLRSQLAMRMLSHHLQPERVVLLPNPPPPPDTLKRSESTAVPPEADDGSFFVMVGDLAPHKGIEDAVAAMSYLPSEAACRLIVCGRPSVRSYSRYLKSMARSQAPGRVIFLGSVRQEQALALMRRSVATIVCSRIENPNRVLVEAMSAGSPIVAADTANSREVCGTAALYYPPADLEALTKTLQDVLNNEALRGELAKRGTEMVTGLDPWGVPRTILRSMGLIE